MLLEMSSNGYGIYVLFDVVCIHLIQNEYILFLSRLLKGILGTFLASEFELHRLTVQPMDNWKPWLTWYRRTFPHAINIYDWPLGLGERLFQDYM
jgi:hypothetical protein